MRKNWLKKLWSTLGVDMFTNDLSSFDSQNLDQDLTPSNKFKNNGDAKRKAFLKRTSKRRARKKFAKKWGK